MFEVVGNLNTTCGESLRTNDVMESLWRRDEENEAEESQKRRRLRRVKIKSVLDSKLTERWGQIRDSMATRR